MGLNLVQVCGLLRLLPSVPLPCGPELLGCCEGQLCGHGGRGYGLVFQSGHLGASLRRPRGPWGGGLSPFRGAQMQPQIRHWRTEWGWLREPGPGRCWRTELGREDLGPWEMRPAFSVSFPGGRGSARQTPKWLGWGMLQRGSMPRDSDGVVNRREGEDDYV